MFVLNYKKPFGFPIKMLPDKTQSRHRFGLQHKNALGMYNPVRSDNSRNCSTVIKINNMFHI